MAFDFKVAVVHHHTRPLPAIDADVIFTDEASHGAYWNHVRALEWAAAQSERVIIMEDDALPVENFRAMASEVLSAWPSDLVSFYLGTGRPKPWQAQVRRAIGRAEQEGREWLMLPKLLHGVCYSVPSPILVLDNLKKGFIDFAIGDAWMEATDRKVVYCLPSLVEHADGPSVEKHPDRRHEPLPRKAWRLP